MHSALAPHDPGHGSTHLFFKQNLLKAQSESKTHSGLHLGLLIAFGPLHKLHTANLSPYVSHNELGSQGFGAHGCAVELSAITMIAVNNKKKYFYFIDSIRMIVKII